MDQLLIEFAKLGLAGVVAYLFYKLYIEEKKAHQITRDKLIESYGARITDSKETTLKVTEPLIIISQGIKEISAKIEAEQEKHI